MQSLKSRVAGGFSGLMLLATPAIVCAQRRSPMFSDLAERRRIRHGAGNAR